MEYSAIWLVVGFLGQAVFGSRFLVQWIASERRRQSVLPTVFILGQAAGFVIYSRNLRLIHRGSESDA